MYNDIVQLLSHVVNAASLFTSLLRVTISHVCFDALLYDRVRREEASFAIIQNPTHQEREREIAVSGRPCAPHSLVVICRQKQRGAV